jgi:hypothetical protein
VCRCGIGGASGGPEIISVSVCKRVVSQGRDPWVKEKGKWCKASRLPQYQEGGKRWEDVTASGPGNHCSIVKFKTPVGVHVYLFPSPLSSQSPAPTPSSSSSCSPVISNSTGLINGLLLLAVSGRIGRSLVCMTSSNAASKPTGESQREKARVWGRREYRWWSVGASLCCDPDGGGVCTSFGVYPKLSCGIFD